MDLAVALLGACIASLGLVGVFGLPRFEELLRWWRELPTSIVRIWCAFVVLFGLSFVWADLPTPVGD